MQRVEPLDDRIDISFDAHPDWTAPYLATEIPRQPLGLVDMADWAAAADLRRWIKAVVQREAPITKDLLYKRLREIWGGASLTVRRTARVDEVVQQLVGSGDLNEVDRGTFSILRGEIWLVRVPGDEPRTRRSVSEVPQVELETALVHLVRDARRVSGDELTSRAAAIFGWQRRGPDIQAGLDRALSRLTAAGRLVETDDGRYVIGD